MAVVIYFFTLMVLITMTRLVYSRTANPCLSVVCQNGGTCTVPVLGNPFCVCPLGFIGANCQTVGILQCPAFTPSPGNICGGFFCTSNANCPNGQICCPNACSSMQCMPGVPVSPCGTCPTGQVCISTGSSFQCVRNNQCGGCRPSLVCRKVTPCRRCPPVFRCT